MVVLIDTLKPHVQDMAAVMLAAYFHEYVRPSPQTAPTALLRHHCKRFT